MNKIDEIAIWANSTTGEDFQCIHIDDARDMETLLREAVEVLKVYSNNDMMGMGADGMIDKINDYLGPE